MFGKKARKIEQQSKALNRLWFIQLAANRNSESYT